MPSKNPLQSAKSPWAYLLTVKENQKYDTALTIPNGFTLKVARGAKCKTKDGLFAEFARALSFPDYFGHDWDALEECLADLEWLPAKGYVVIVTDAEQVLAKDKEEYPTFIDILNDAGESWSSRQGNSAAQTGVPFHIVLVVSERHKSARKSLLVPALQCEDTRGRATRNNVSKIRSKGR